MSEISTRVWLDEGLWQKVRNRAIADGTTVRELIPRLITQILSQAPTKGAPPGKARAVEVPPPPSTPATSGPPVIELSDVYHCGVCGTDVKVGGMLAEKAAAAAMVVKKESGREPQAGQK